MDWTQVFTIVGANLVLMLAGIGTTVTLFLWSRSEARHDQAQIRDLIKEIQNEMKDFHGKMQKLDAEFKSHLMYEHNNKKVE
jgi:hypothetical protein